MEKIIIKPYIILLVLLFLSCNEIQHNQENVLLEEAEIQNNDEIESLLITPNQEWINKAKMALEMKEGDTVVINKFAVKYKQNKKEESEKNSYLIDVEPFQKQNNDFEYSEEWRKEAYKVAKQYLIKKVHSDDPACSVIRQGLYQPNLVRYTGGQGYLIQLYCEFDCGNDYNNPSICWIEGYYLGNNRWDMKLVKQRFTD